LRTRKKKKNENGIKSFFYSVTQILKFNLLQDILIWWPNNKNIYDF